MLDWQNDRHIDLRNKINQKWNHTNMPNWHLIKIQKQFSGRQTAYLTNGAEQLEVHSPKQSPNKQKQKKLMLMLYLIQELT